MARILILRDERAAAATARLIEAGGDEPVLLPVQAIEPLSPEPPDRPFGGLILTSANAVPFLARGMRVPHPPILAVGEATAEALAEAGLTPAHVGSAGGRALAAEAARLHARSGRPLLYLAGRVRTEGLERELEALGLPCETLEVYDTRPLDPDRESVGRALAGRAVDAVLLLSVVQAEAARRLLTRDPDLFAPSIALLCLSRRVRAALPEALREEAIVAPQPQLSALLDRYRRSRADRSPNGRP